MGEWSKAVGEHGEDVAAVLLKTLGWGDFQKGVSVKCVKPQPHAITGERQTHGIDFLFSYKSPLCDDLCENLYISNKYTGLPYPKNQPSIFRNYYDDLAQTIQCFKKSSAYADQIARIPRCDKSRNLGVILWLSNVETEVGCREAVSKIDVLQTSDKYDGIYLIDNEVAAFLYDTITYVKGLDLRDKVTFAYIDSGKCTDPSARHFSGDILPVEYATLGILAFKSLGPANSGTLTLCCIDSFNEASLGRFIGLSQSISQDWASQIRILFPDFNVLEDSNVVGRVKNAFADKSITAKLVVGSYRPTLQNASI